MTPSPSHPLGGYRTPDAAAPAVLEVAVREPKCLPVDITVGTARAALSDDHVHMLLLTNRGRLVGTIVRDDLAGALRDSDPALSHSRVDGRTIGPRVPAEVARRRLLATGHRRLAVVSDDGELLGLLCLKKHRNGFCSDHDVAARVCD